MTWPQKKKKNSTYKTYHYPRVCEELWRLWLSESSSFHYIALKDQRASVLRSSNCTALKKKKHKFCLMTENIKLHRQPLPWNNCNSLHHALEQRPRTVSTLPATQEHYAACEWLNVHVCPTHRVSRYSVGLNVYYTIPMFMCADKTHKILNTFLYSSTSHDKLYSIFDFNIPNCCFLIFYVKEAVL